MKANLMNHIVLADLYVTDFNGILHGFNNFVPSLKSLLKTAFLYSFIEPNKSCYVAPGWTIYIEFTGSIICMMAIGCLKNKKYRAIFYVLSALIFKNVAVYLIYGMMAADIYINFKDKFSFLRSGNIKMAIFLYALLLMSVFAIHTVKFPFRKDVFSSLSYSFLILLFLSLPKGDLIFGNRFFRFIAKNSYSIYLIHWPILQSLSCSFYIWILKKHSITPVTIAINLIISAAVVLPVSVLCNKYIETTGAKIAKLITSKNTDQNLK